MNSSLKFLCNSALWMSSAIAVATPITDYCGGGDWSYENSYYALVDQREMVAPQFYPLLYCPEASLCGIEQDSKSVNIESWKQYLGYDFSHDDIDQLVYGHDLKWYEGVKRGAVMSTLSRKLTTQKLQYFIEYMLLAKRAESSSSNLYDGQGWYQGESGPTVDKAAILEQSLGMIRTAPDKFMKHRVAFQAVRAAHYLQRNALAVDLFEKNFNVGQPDYMYYRAQEQAAGASFNLKNTRAAIAGFESAFMNMPDRRYNNALNLKITYEQAFDGAGNTSGVESMDSYYFFTSFLGKRSEVAAMRDLMNIDVNSAYLQLLIARKIDQIQSKIFMDGDGYYFYQEEIKDNSGIEKVLADLVNNNKELKAREPVYLLQSLIAIQSKDFESAKEVLTNINPKSNYADDASRLNFIIKAKELKCIEPQQINELFQELERRNDLHQYPAVVAAFFNTIADLYSKNGDAISAALISIDYLASDSYQTYDYQQAKERRRYNYEFDLRYPLLEKTVIESFEDHLASKTNKTAFEQLILNRLEVQPMDFANDLMGNYKWTQGDVEGALGYFKKVENPSDFWDENVRPEIVSSSIKEWMNVDFASISDNIHHNYRDLVGSKVESDDLENYRDNKIKLIKLMLELERLGSLRSSNQADYNYMLANIWYNISVEGWFVNDLYYVGNNGRNPLIGYRWDDEPLEAKYEQVIHRAGDHFKKAVDSKGSEETKAKATFALAKTNRCFTEEYDANSGRYIMKLCGDHVTYFDKLAADYSDTDYYKEVLKECSWFTEN